jgi:hypothetical protein
MYPQLKVALAILCGTLVLCGCGTTGDSVRQLSNSEIKSLLSDVSIEPVGAIVADHHEVFWQKGVLQIFGRGQFITTYYIKDGAVCVRYRPPSPDQCRSVFQDASSNLYFGIYGQPFSGKTVGQFRTVPAKQ